MGASSAAQIVSIGRDLSRCVLVKMWVDWLMFFLKKKNISASFLFVLSMVSFFAVAKAIATPPSSHIARQPHIEVELVSSPTGQSGAHSTGVVFRPDPGWHIYWRNPGDTGLAPVINWSKDISNSDFEHTELYWPFPEIIPIAHLVNIGYHDEVVLWREWAAAPERISADVNWLVCKESCVPGSASLSLAISANAGDSTEFDFDYWQSKIPVPMPLMGASVRLEDKALMLELYAEKKFIPQGAIVDVVVENLDVVTYGPPEQLFAANNVVIWRQSLNEYFNGLPKVLKLVVVVDGQRAYSFAIESDS